MEAVPRLHMLCFPSKSSPEGTSFAGLKKYIAEFYQENPDNYSKELYTLETLRNQALNTSKDQCPILKRYFCQLESLLNRFPKLRDKKVIFQFTWKDLYSSKVQEFNDIGYEQAAVLFNIATAHTQAGASVNRDVEGMKVACTHFQCAAWCFGEIRERYINMDEFGDCFTTELLVFMQQVSFAQAQECFLEKSLIDNRKPNIVAKVTAQIVVYYGAALAALLTGGDDGPVAQVVDSAVYKTWKRYVRFKISYLNCILYLYQGQHAEEQRKMGQRVTLFEAAWEKLEEARKESKGLPDQKEINESLIFTADVVEAKRKNAKNENEFIYHETVPELATISAVQGANLVNGIGFSVTDPEVAGEDIFARLVPMKAHEASSLYSEEKAKLLRKYGAEIEERDGELASYMSSLTLDNLNINEEKANKIPQGIVDRCAALNANKTAIPELIASMARLNDICGDVETNLKEISSILQKEEQQEKEFQQLSGVQRTPNAHITELSREFQKYTEAHSRAEESNDTLRKAMELHINNLKILAKPLPEIQQSVPKLSSELNTTEIFKDVKLIVNKVNEMKAQRSQFHADLRIAVNEDDITSKIIAHDCEEDLQELFDREMAKHERLTQLLDQNLLAQENILKALTESYAKAAPVLKTLSDVKHKRESFFASLAASYDVYEDLLAKSANGLEFYNKLSANVQKLLSRCKSARDVQSEERQQRLKSVVSKQQQQQQSASIPSCTMPLDNNNYPNINDMTSTNYTPTSTSTSSTPKLRDYMNAKKAAKERNSTMMSNNNNNTGHAGQTYIPPIRPNPLGSENPTQAVCSGNSSYYSASSSAAGGIGGNISASSSSSVPPTVGPNEPPPPYTLQQMQYYDPNAAGYTNPMYLQYQQNIAPPAYKPQASPNSQFSLMNNQMSAMSIQGNNQQTSVGYATNQTQQSPYNNYQSSPQPQQQQQQQFYNATPQQSYMNNTMYPSSTSIAQPDPQPNNIPQVYNQQQPLAQYQYGSTAVQQQTSNATAASSYTQQQQPMYNAYNQTSLNSTPPTVPPNQPLYVVTSAQAVAGAGQAQQVSSNPSSAAVVPPSLQAPYIVNNAVQQLPGTVPIATANNSSQMTTINPLTTIQNTVGMQPHQQPLTYIQPYAAVTSSVGATPTAVATAPIATTANVISPAMLTSTNSSTVASVTPSNAAQQAYNYNPQTGNYNYGSGYQQTTAATQQYHGQYTTGAQPLNMNVGTTDSQASGKINMSTGFDTPIISHTKNPVANPAATATPTLPTTPAPASAQQTTESKPTTAIDSNTANNYYNSQYAYQTNAATLTPLPAAAAAADSAMQQHSAPVMAPQQQGLGIQQQQQHPSMPTGFTQQQQSPATYMQSGAGSTAHTQTTTSGGNAYASSAQQANQPAPPVKPSTPANIPKAAPKKSSNIDLLSDIDFSGISSSAVPPPILPEPVLKPEVVSSPPTSQVAAPTLALTKKEEEPVEKVEKQKQVEDYINSIQVSPQPSANDLSAITSVASNVPQLQSPLDSPAVRKTSYDNLSNCSDISSLDNFELDSVSMLSEKRNSIYNAALNNQQQNNANTFQLKPIDPFTDDKILKYFHKEVERYERTIESLNIKMLNGHTPLSAKWKELEDLLAKDAKTRTTAIAKLFPEKNRSLDCLPYDHARVKLDKETDDYINAAFIKDLGSGCPNLIIAQTPQQNTINDFWSMIWSQKVRTVLSLHPPNEMLDPFWPQQQDKEIHYDDYTVRCMKIIQLTHCIEYQLKLSMLGSDAIIEMAILQIQTWTKGNPSLMVGIARNALQSHQQRCLNFNCPQSPLVLNCLTGSERSELVAIALCAILATQIKRPVLINVVDVWHRICCQRQKALRDIENLEQSLQIVLNHAHDVLNKRGIMTSYQMKIAPQVTAQEKQASKDPLSELDALWKLK